MNAAASLRLFDPGGGALGRQRFRMMVLMRIERWDVRRDGPLTEAALQQKIDSLGYDALVREYPAGAAGGAQSDLRERLVAVVRGLVKVTLDGESAILGAGDLVFVPRGTVRRVEAIGATDASCFEAAYRTSVA